MDRTLGSIAKSAFDSLLDLVFPPKCVLCDEFGSGYLCESCASNIPKPIPEPICPRCGHHRQTLPCTECLADPPYFVVSMAAGTYTAHLREAIHWLKYRERPMLAEPLGLILAAYAKRNRAQLGSLAFDTIVPIPMHSIRQRLRGYNHAERLALVVGRELCIPVNSRLLKRTRRTKPQVGLDGEDRRNNLKGAFTASGTVAGKAILLLDDVSTTGATQREAAKALKLAGAKAVYCLSLAAG